MSCRAFISQREQPCGEADVLRRMEKMDEKLNEHDEVLSLRADQGTHATPKRIPPPPAPKPRIDFIREPDPVSLGLRIVSRVFYRTRCWRWNRVFGGRGETFSRRRGVFCRAFSRRPDRAGRDPHRGAGRRSGNRGGRGRRPISSLGGAGDEIHRSVRPRERIDSRATKAGGMGGLLSFDVRATVAGETVAEGRIYPFTIMQMDFDTFCGAVSFLPAMRSGN